MGLGTPRNVDLEKSIEAASLFMPLRKAAGGCMQCNALARFLIERRTETALTKALSDGLGVRKGLTQEKNWLSHL